MIIKLYSSDLYTSFDYLINTIIYSTNKKAVKTNKKRFIIGLAGGAGGPQILAVLRMEEAACWCCFGACGSEDWWGRLPL